jgi:GNAT superfamily N-acetyltransferase
VEGLPIRNARRGDIPSLLLLWTAMMKETAAADGRLAPHPRAREHMAAQFANWLLDPHRFVAVAEENGRLVVGFAAGAIVPGDGWREPTRLGQVTDCYVAPPRRRTGIARRLVGRVLDQLYEKGVNTVRVAVAARNEPSHAFWQSIGWTDLECVYEREVRPPDAAPGAGS